MRIFQVTNGAMRLIEFDEGLDGKTPMDGDLVFTEHRIGEAKNVIYGARGRLNSLSLDICDVLIVPEGKQYRLLQVQHSEYKNCGILRSIGLVDMPPKPPRCAGATARPGWQNEEFDV